MKTSEQIFSLIKEFKPSYDFNTLSESTNLFSVGILDSFGMLEYISKLEEQFNIEVSNDDLIPQNFWNVEQTAITIEKYIQ